jgi:RNA polymerase sigma factor (TIGR02999 family)
MSEVSRILSAIQQGDPRAAPELLPLVYNELRRLAAQKLAQEAPGQTLQATALVHEAYLRLAGPKAAAQAAPGEDDGRQWDSRRHFFAAAAEAMRRILIEAARGKRRLKHQGARVRLEFNASDFAAPERSAPLLALDEALDRLTAANPQAGELVKLRYFAGFTNVEAAGLLGISPRKAQQIWAYARAWLLEELGDGNAE